MSRRIPLGEAYVEVKPVKLGKKFELRLIAVLSPEQLLEFLDDLRFEVEEVISRIEKGKN